MLACLAAADEVGEETGHRAVYVPNLIGTPSQVFRQLRFAEDAGARAVMVSPCLIGLPTFWELCHEHASVPILAHPAWSGAQRIAAEAMFGKIFRLFGADAVIYVNYGGRFGVDRDQCRRLADNLTMPWASVLSALPVPAGGIAVESVDDIVGFYGRDSMLLIGGGLQADPAPGSVAARSRAFVEAVQRASGSNGN